MLSYHHYGCGFFDKEPQSILARLSFNKSIAFGLPDKYRQFILLRLAFNNSIAFGFVF